MNYDKDFKYGAYVRPNIYPSLINKAQAGINGPVIDPVSPLRIKLEGLSSDPLPPYHLKTNTYGYRSDEFTARHTGKHILFAGCSETFGQGGELEDLWAHRVYSAIAKEEEVSGFYNLGKCGAGFQDIIYFVTDYIEKFAKPDVLFIMFPNVNRFVSYLNFDKQNKSASGYYPVANMAEHLTIAGSGIGMGRDEDGRYSTEAFFDLYAHFVLNIKMLDTFCKTSGINFMWSTWDSNGLTGSRYQRKDSLSRNYVMAEDDEKRLYEEIEKDNSLTLIKKDMHKGTAYHKIWADSFYKLYKERQRRFDKQR